MSETFASKGVKSTFRGLIISLVLGMVIIGAGLFFASRNPTPAVPGEPGQVQTPDQPTTPTQPVEPPKPKLNFGK